MSDLIDRQAAIDALEREKTYCSAFREGYSKTDIFKKYNMGLTDGIKAIKNIPSVQPEIIRCKDCKHKHIENMVWVCPFGLPGGEEFYCGYGAEPKGEQE